MVDNAALLVTMDRAIRPLILRYDVPGIAVAITVDGHAMFFNYGVASKETGVPITEHTLFEIGSVSKTFTATMACYAKDSGKLAFTDKLDKTIPELKGTPIGRSTLFELGTYTAGGLPLQVPDEIADDAQLFNYLRAFRPESAPGYIRRYSNMSIFLLGRAITNALHDDFEVIMQRDLLNALGLASTYVQVPPAAQADYAWGYEEDDQPVRMHLDLFNVEAYGIKSNASDMVRYLQDNINPTPLSAAMRSALDCTHLGYFQAGQMVQGIGWEQYRPPVTLPRILEGHTTRMRREATPVTHLTSNQAAPAGTLLSKTGSTRGFGAYAAFIPSQGIGIVILANKNYPVAARVEAGYAILTQLAQGRTTDAAR